MNITIGALARGYIRDAIWAAIGAGVGAAVTSAVLKRKYEKQVEEDIEQVKRAYKKRLDEAEKAIETVEEASPSTQIINVYEQPPTPDETVTERTEYNKMRVPYSEAPATKEVTDRYVVTLEDFQNSEYEKVTLKYYVENDALIEEETDSYIVDRANLIGDDALNHFGYGGDSPDIVYVRNDYYEVDYEVVRISKS